MTEVTLPPYSRPTLISGTRVDNIHPTTSAPYRLAVVGEAPGEREVQFGRPFVGPSGELINEIFSGLGIDRSACFIGNVCKYQPPGNDILNFGYSHEKVTQGWAELQDELRAFNPFCILALGNTPLHFLAGRAGVTRWQASILGTAHGKLVPAVHPASVLREYRQRPLLIHACRRALEEATSPTLSLPQRTLDLELSSDEICNRLYNWPAGLLLSFDIEGGLDAFPCCSVVGHPLSGFIIAWTKHSTYGQGRIARALSTVLYRCDVPKCLQNSLYDRFVLAYGYRMLIRNVTEDTLDKQWAIYSELPKGLGTIAAIWTREPYYKFERKEHSSQDEFYRYCIKDSCVTLEACQEMDKALIPPEENHYRFNVSLKSALLYMQLRGFRFDHAACNAELSKIEANMETSIAYIESQVQPMQFTKKELTNRIRGAGGSIGDARLKRVLYEQKGYPIQKKGRGLNAKVTSDAVALLNIAESRRKITGKPDDFIQALLLHKKLETTKETLEWKTDFLDGRMKCSYNQFSKGEDGAEEGGGATETGRLRCSQSIIPSGHFKKNKAIPVGGNLQTVTKKLRRLYLADEGHWLFQCDLAGADGWTVAARCLEHGDSTMWDDYRAGLKPAKIIALMFAKGADAVKCSREELVIRCKDVDGHGWLYFACKRVQHGSNYGMQEKTMAMQILKDSYNISGKPVFVEPSVCASLQRLYLSRYPGVYAWQNWAKKEVREGRNLTSASGHTRKFFGRRTSYDSRRKCYDADHETWKEFLADEPQENTTYATNLALYKLWNDLDNRVSRLAGIPHDMQLREGGGALQQSAENVRERQADRVLFQTEEPANPPLLLPRLSRPSSLIIQPLHQVHDALIGQFSKEHTAWAIAKIREYFNNPMRIAGIEVTIPFEGAYGPSWGELGEKYGGGTI